MVHVHGARTCLQGETLRHVKNLKTLKTRLQKYKTNACHLFYKWDAVGGGGHLASYPPGQSEDRRREAGLALTRAFTAKSLSQDADQGDQYTTTGYVAGLAVFTAPWGRCPEVPGFCVSHPH